MVHYTTLHGLLTLQGPGLAGAGRSDKGHYSRPHCSARFHPCPQVPSKLLLVSIGLEESQQSIKNPNLLEPCYCLMLSM